MAEAHRREQEEKERQRQQAAAVQAQQEAIARAQAEQKQQQQSVAVSSQPVASPRAVNVNGMLLGSDLLLMGFVCNIVDLFLSLPHGTLPSAFFKHEPVSVSFFLHALFLSLLLTG